VRTTYEWVAENTNSDGDIVDTCGHDTLAAAKSVAALPGCAVVISLRRDVGDDRLGIVDRQQAYAGDVCFDGGAAIPKRFARDFASLHRPAGNSSKEN